MVEYDSMIVVGDELAFANESEMLFLEMISENLVEELGALLKTMKKNKKHLSYLAEYNQRKKFFVDLVFSNNLNEAHKTAISNIR